MKGKDDNNAVDPFSVPSLEDFFRTKKENIDGKLF